VAWAVNEMKNDPFLSEIQGKKRWPTFIFSIRQ